MAEALVVDGLTFAVARSTRRTTAAIVIDREGQLVLQIPAGLSDTRAAQAARDRLPWVHRKLSERLLRARIPRKKFVPGESFGYLGRTYRLAFTDTEIDEARLRHGYLQVPRSLRQDAEQLLRDWYTRHGQQWFEKRTQAWVQRVGAPDLDVKVRDLGYRWGSLSEDGTVNFHWQAIALPPSISDYLIAHELTHLQHPTHDQAYWRALLRVMPDAERRRDWLRQNGEGW